MNKNAVLGKQGQAESPSSLELSFIGSHSERLEGTAMAWRGFGVFV